MAKQEVLKGAVFFVIPATNNRQPTHVEVPEPNLSILEL